MPNPYGTPEITPREVAQRLNGGEEFILLDVREPMEFDMAGIQHKNVIQMPLSRLSIVGPEALPEAIRQDKDADVVVMCHHGSRSAQVTAWLRSQGWTRIANLDGGINAYALEVDPSVGRY
ncbi:MAG TPA: rhodanese-like domain-containing protein [Calditrichia bacterium]|nr:hypothetical protein [Calditrichota bacterium]HQV31698.1 rhodanese-like domain-containing protein [Calditrichia bacterium]